MMKKTINTLAILLLSVSTLAVAAPFSVTWTDTIGAGSEAPYIVGQSLSVTYVLDNGGTSTISQTWNAADVVSVTFELNNGAITTVFDPNGGGGFDLTLGNFATDSTGALISVPVDWESANDSVVSSNDPQGTTNLDWFVDKFNGVYYNASADPDIRIVNATNVTNNIIPAFWSLGGTPPPPPPSTSTAVPTMPVYALILTILGLLLVATRRLHPTFKRS
jgi:hypothetical protein